MPLQVGRDWARATSSLTSTIVSLDLPQHSQLVLSIVGVFVPVLGLSMVIGAIGVEGVLEKARRREEIIKLSQS